MKKVKEFIELILGREPSFEERRNKEIEEFLKRKPKPANFDIYHFVRGKTFTKKQAEKLHNALNPSAYLYVKTRDAIISSILVKESE